MIEGGDDRNRRSVMLIAIVPDYAGFPMENSRRIIAIVSPEVQRMTKRESNWRAFETCAGNKQSSII